MWFYMYAKHIWSEPAPININLLFSLDRGNLIKDHDGAKWNKMCTFVFFFPKGNINLTLDFQSRRILIAVHNKQKIQTTIILKLLAALYFYQGIWVPFQH